MPQPLNIMGIPVHPVTVAVSRQLVISFIEAGQRGKTVYSINPEILMAAKKDKQLAAALREGTLNLPDGMGVVWAGKILGKPLPARAPGIDLLEALLAVCEENNYRIFLFGGKEGVATRAAQKIKKNYPGINIVGTRNGYFSSKDLAPIKDTIAACAPHILMVGLGCPRQEIFIYKEALALGIPVSMAVGGSFDVLAGDVKRAPAFLRKSGLEWFYRLISQPKRWRRIFVLPFFVCLVLKERFLSQNRRKSNLK